MAPAAAKSMRDRLIQWRAALRRAVLRLVESVRRDPLPYAGSATALLGIVLLLAARGRVLPTAPGTASTRGNKTQVIYYTPQPTETKTSQEPPTQAVTTPPVEAAPPEWPITGAVVQGYGWTYDRTAGYWYFHAAWDIAGQTGEVARAAMPGTVESVSASPALGEVVVITGQDGLSETYGGFTSVAVASGESVQEGQTIGTLGPVAGERSGVHLHFSIERGQQPVDPAQILPAP